jgi:hypothetical protein
MLGTARTVKETGMKKIWLAAVAAVVALAMPALAGGFLTNGLPVAGQAPYASTLPLTGIEQVPADTLRAGGAAPQSEAITVDQIKAYVLGGTGASAASTATATSGAATCDAGRCIVTSEALTTAAAGVYTLTVTNSRVAASSIVLVSVADGTNTTVGATLLTVAPGAGSVVIKIQNNHASAALDGTLKVSMLVIN